MKPKKYLIVIIFVSLLLGVPLVSAKNNDVEDNVEDKILVAQSTLIDFIDEVDNISNTEQRFRKTGDIHPKKHLAGMWIDQKGNPHIAVTKDDKVLTKIAQKLSIDVVIHKNSYEDLIAFQNEIFNLDDDIVATSISEDKNELIIKTALQNADSLTKKINSLNKNGVSFKIITGASMSENMNM